MADYPYGFTTMARLEAFHAAYRRRNLTAAARELDLGDAKPNRGRVWRLLQELEHDLWGDTDGEGPKLFEKIERGGRQQAGETIRPLPEAEAIEPIVSSIIEHLAHLKQTATGTTERLRVACFPAHVHEFLAELVSATPDLLELHEVDDAYRPEGGAGLFRLLKAGHVDLVVAPDGDHPEHKKLVVYDWTIVVAGTDKWLPKGTTSVSAAELAAVPLLLSPHGHNSRRVVEAAFAAAHLEPHVLHQSRSTESLMSMVDAGLGVAVLPSDALWDAPGRTFGVFGTVGEHVGSHALYWRRDAREQRVMDAIAAARELVAARGREPKLLRRR